MRAPAPYRRMPNLARVPVRIPPRRRHCSNVTRESLQWSANVPGRGAAGHDPVDRAAARVRAKWRRSADSRSTRSDRPGCRRPRRPEARDDAGDTHHVDRLRRRSRRAVLQRRAGRSATSSSRNRTRDSPPPSAPRSGSSSTTRTSTSAPGCGSPNRAGASPPRCGATPTLCSPTITSASPSTPSTTAATATAWWSNALGGMLDWSITNDQPNNNWNGIWDVRTADFDQGWTVEFRFPFRSFRFREGGHVWGINFRRRVRWKNELAFLVPVLRRPGAARRCRGCRLPATVGGIDVPSQAAQHRSQALRARLGGHGQSRRHAALLERSRTATSAST